MISLWQVIDLLTQQIPFSRQKIKATLSTQLIEVEDVFNKLYHFYKSVSIQLAGGVVISNVDLRIKRYGNHPGFLVLRIDGICITVEELRKQYGDLQITQVPHGRSLDEETSLSSSLSWGKLSFGFKERSPNCLATIAFDPLIQYG